MWHERSWKSRTLGTCFFWWEKTWKTVLFTKPQSLVKSIGPWSIGAGVFETGEIAQVEVLDESFGSQGVVDIVDVLHTLWKKIYGRSGPFICRDCRVYMVYRHDMTWRYSECPHGYETWGLSLHFLKIELHLMEMAMIADAQDMWRVEWLRGKI